METVDTGLILICDCRGVIERAIRDDLGMGDRVAPGTSLVELVDPGSASKASGFLQAMRDEGAALGWPMSAPVGGELTLLYFIGAVCEGRCIVIAGPGPGITERILSGATGLDAAQRDTLSEIIRRYSQQQDQQEHEDGAIWERMARLNSELAAKQRELVQKNAELDRRNAQLEETQRQLRQERDRLRRANAQLKALATYDELTGLRNRRAFDHYLDQEFRRARRHSTPLSLLLLDLDRFKEFNDTFGHAAGDEALRAAAEALGRAIDPTDIAARYGGEELAVLLVNCPAPAADQAAERCRRAIEAIEELDGRLTASVGVASFTADMDEGVELVEAADEALYRAKDAGRNRVCRLEHHSRNSTAEPQPGRASA